MNLITKGLSLYPHISQPPRRRRRLTAALLATLAAGTAALGAPDDSRAASYVNVSCTATTGIADASGGWTPFGTPRPGVQNFNNCDWGGLHSEAHPTSADPMPKFTIIGWRYDAPADTRIVAFTGTLTGWARAFGGTGSRGVVTVDLSRLGRMKLLTAADTFYPAGVDLAYWGVDERSIMVGAACDGGSPCPQSTAWFSLHKPKVYLDDDTPPAVGSSSGSAKDDNKWVGVEELAYTASDAGGGIARLRVYVDGTPRVDHVVDSLNGHCTILGTELGAWQFGYPKPCPSGVSDTEKIDSTAFTDGQHTITVKVVDAAQREATVYTGTKLVANHPPVNTAAPAFVIAALAAAPVTGMELAVNDAKWTGPDLTLARAWQRCDSTGASCVAIPGANGLAYKPTAEDVGHRLRYAVTATNVAGSMTSYSQTTGLVSAPSSHTETTPKPNDGKDGSNGANGAPGALSPTITLPGLPSTATSATTHTFVGRVAGEAEGVACPGDRATLKFEHVRSGKVALPYGKAGVAQLELTCTTTGKAITGAKLQIATKVPGQSTVAADVTTDGAGHAALRLARGASRGITVGYKMYSDDPIARATATLKVVVAGRVSIRADRQTLRNGRPVRLRGQLLGGLVPRRGVDLAVQWRDGKRWRPFAQIRTDRKGRFTYAYKFTRTSRKLTYRLRVQVGKGQVDYPYAPAASRAVKVTVAP